MASEVSCQADNTTAIDDESYFECDFNHAPALSPRKCFLILALSRQANKYHINSNSETIRLENQYKTTIK